jgi:hypothetical protein
MNNKPNIITAESSTIDFYNQVTFYTGTNLFNDVLNNEQVTSVRKSSLPLDSIILPTYSNLNKITSGLSVLLSSFFEQKGINYDSPVDIKVDTEEGKIEVSGDRDDIAVIGEAINSNPDLKEKIITVNAIASHVCQMPEHLAFQKEYFISDDPEQVINKYSHLFNEDSCEPELKMKFFGNSIKIYLNGEAWNNG